MAETKRSLTRLDSSVVAVDEYCAPSSTATSRSPSPSVIAGDKEQLLRQRALLLHKRKLGADADVVFTGASRTASVSPSPDESRTENLPTAAAIVIRPGSAASTLRNQLDDLRRWKAEHDAARITCTDLQNRCARLADELANAQADAQAAQQRVSDAARHVADLVANVRASKQQLEQSGQLVSQLSVVDEPLPVGNTPSIESVSLHAPVAQHFKAGTTTATASSPKFAPLIRRATRSSFSLTRRPVVVPSSAAVLPASSMIRLSNRSSKSLVRTIPSQTQQAIVFKPTGPKPNNVGVSLVQQATRTRTWVRPGVVSAKAASSASKSTSTTSVVKRRRLNANAPMATSARTGPLQTTSAFPRATASALHSLKLALTKRRDRKVELLTNLHLLHAKSTLQQLYLLSNAPFVPNTGSGATLDFASLQPLPPHMCSSDDRRSGRLGQCHLWVELLRMNRFQQSAVTKLHGSSAPSHGEIKQNTSSPEEMLRTMQHLSDAVGGSSIRAPVVCVPRTILRLQMSDRPW
jgi:hypothetical protein